MWMFLTNVLYPLPEGGSTTMRLLTTANPMVPLISAYRAIMIDGRMPEPAGLAGTAVFAVLLAWSGWVMYRVLEGRFAERV